MNSFIKVLCKDVDTNESDADTSLASLSTNLNNEGAARLLADNSFTSLSVSMLTWDANGNLVTDWE